MSRQRPIVRFFAVCADATLAIPESGDLQAGWWELHNVLHTVWMPPGIVKGFGQKELFIYAQLTDGLGTFHLGVSVEEVDLANPKRNRLMGRSYPCPMTFTDPWQVVEEVFRLIRVPFPKPGQYRFQLLENGAELEGGTVFLRVMPGEIS